MELELIRTYGTETETLGYLNINGEFFCYTLEDAVRDHKIKSHTCIPYGKYFVTLTWSPRFKRNLPLIYNDPKTLAVIADNGDRWDGVRFHGGNTHLDTDGCPLLAYNQYKNKPLTVTKNGVTTTVQNYIQGSAEKEFNQKFKPGIAYPLVIKHADELQKQTLYRLRNPMMKDGVIYKIQSTLNTLGFNVGIPDGIFGPRTERAVKDFQAKFKLNIDGIVGPQTLEALKITK